MKRGPIILSKSEIKEVVLMMQSAGFDNLLAEKFHSAGDSPEEKVSLLLSEEEVEQILDHLAPPIENENQALSSVRANFQSALSKLRLGS